MESNVQGHEGETVVLRIDVLSSPPPHFSWFKLTGIDEWSPVGRFKHMTVFSGSLQSNLTIPRIGPQDAGRYKVVASNGIGKPLVQEYEVFIEGRLTCY